MGGREGWVSLERREHREGARRRGHANRPLAANQFPKIRVSLAWKGGCIRAGGGSGPPASAVLSAHVCYFPSALLVLPLPRLIQSVGEGRGLSVEGGLSLPVGEGARGWA